MIVNKEQVKEMIINKNDFELRVSIDLEGQKCKNIFIKYDKNNNNFDFVIDEHNNDNEIYEVIYTFFLYNNLLDIIKYCYNIELLKKDDKILNVNNYIDFEQYNYYDMLERTNKLIIDYSVIYNQCRKINNFILQDDVNERQVQLQKEYKDIIIELNNYYVENFDNNKIYDNEEDIYYYSDNKNNRYEELKKQYIDFL